MDKIGVSLTLYHYSHHPPPDTETSVRFNIIKRKIPWDPWDPCEHCPNISGIRVSRPHPNHLWDLTSSKEKFREIRGICVSIAPILVRSVWALKQASGICVSRPHPKPLWDLTSTKEKFREIRGICVSIAPIFAESVWRVVTSPRRPSRCISCRLPWCRFGRFQSPCEPW